MTNDAVAARVRVCVCVAQVPKRQIKISSKCVSYWSVGREASDASLGCSAIVLFVSKDNYEVYFYGGRSEDVQVSVFWETERLVVYGKVLKRGRYQVFYPLGWLADWPQYGRWS